jgi:DNA-binding MarR family transcriptional regulator
MTSHGEPATADDRDAPAASLERELRRLARGVRRLALDLAHAVHPNLDAAAYALLVALVERGPSRASELAADQGITKGVISRQVRALESLGLVQRAPDASDARAQILVVTEGARAAYEQSQQARWATVEQLLEGATDSQRRAMVAALARINDVLDGR